MQKDAAILEAALEAEPDNGRHAFYLAQSWFDAGHFDKALRAYAHRADMPGWPESFYARYRLAACLHHVGRPLDEVLEAYEACFRAFPHRAEPLVRAATLARGADRFAEAYVLGHRTAEVPKPGPSALFVDALDYEFRALDEQAIAAFYCGFAGEAFDVCTELLDHRTLPETDRQRIEANRDFSVPALKDGFLRYDAGHVARIAARQPSPTPRVTLTVTSCKRLKSLHQHHLVVPERLHRHRPGRPVRLRRR